ncbi:MAG: putative alpha/beta-fold hydrolase [Cocleimonas sp.]|jgi:predicted alpha/beta-fold hydrolase
MPIINSDFKPAWWLKNPHLQSIWGTAFKHKPEIELIPQRIELDDGDFIDVLKTKDIKNKPIVLILHGMEGSVESHYAKPLIHKLDMAGYGVYFMHFRSCSGELNRLPRGYSSNDSADIQAVIESIKFDKNRSPFAVIGFSLGGSVALKWLGEKAENADTTVGIAVSVPFRLRDAAIKLEKGFSRVYQYYLVSTCQRKYQEKEELLSSPLKVNVKELNTFYRYDDEITAPLNGFKSAEDYYEKCSSRQFLKSIRKPTLILHAKDDPFMWDHSAPREHELSKDVHLELTEQGGHVGFISGKYPWRSEYWLDQRILQWLQEQQQTLLN